MSPIDPPANRDDDHVDENDCRLFSSIVFPVGYMKETRQDKIEKSFFIPFIETIDD